MPRANLTETTVLDAGLTLADRDGFDTVTVSAVARELGVQPASLYGHVPGGRQGLLDGMQRLALRDLGARIGSAVAGRSGRAALGALADVHRVYAHERPGAWAALQRPASDDTAASDGAAQVASLTLAVLRGYPVPDQATVHAARFVGSTINGFLALTRSGSFSHRSEPEADSWAAVIDALDRALATWPDDDGGSR